MKDMLNIGQRVIYNSLNTDNHFGGKYWKSLFIRVYHEYPSTAPLL